MCLLSLSILTPSLSSVGQDASRKVWTSLFLSGKKGNPPQRFAHPGGIHTILYRNGAFQVIFMAVSSLDILNLSHSFKDVCDAHAKSPECLSCTLRLLLEYNLIQANLEFSRRFCCDPKAADDAASKNCKKEFPSAESQILNKVKNSSEKEADSGRI